MVIEFVGDKDCEGKIDKKIEVRKLNGKDRTLRINAQKEVIPGGR